jgi:RNA polymerase sigma-70 factor (ECF subfamily)
MSVSQKSGAPALAEPEGGFGRASELRRLVVAHQRGDPDAFAALVRLTFPAMYRHAHRRLIDTRAAEDAVQEALLRAYRALPALRGDYQVAAWLHRIVANVCADEGNRRRREAMANARLSAQPETPHPSAEESTSRTEVARTVAAAIGALPSSYREALVLRDILELEYADVASRAGITEDNARARVHRARAALRRLVDSSLVLGGTVVGGFRRLGRTSIESVQHASTAASTTLSTAATTVTTLPPEVVAAPARMSVAAASITVAAVAAAAAVPALSSAPSVSPRRTQPVAAPSIQVMTPDPTSTTSITLTTADGTKVSVAVASALDSTTTVLAAAPRGSTTTTSTTEAPATTTIPSHTSTQPVSQPVSATGGGATSSGTGSDQPPPADPTRWKVQGLLVASGGGIDAQTGQSLPTRLAGSASIGGQSSQRSVGGTIGGPVQSDCGSEFGLRFAWTDGSGTDWAIVVRGWALESPANPGTWQLSSPAEVDKNGQPLGTGSFLATLVFNGSGTAASLSGSLSSAAATPSACPMPAASS